MRENWLIAVSMLLLIGDVVAGDIAWRSVSGLWSDSDRWGGKAPTVGDRAAIHGACEVTVPEGRFVVGGLEVGTDRGDRVRMRIDGGELIIRRDLFRLGETTGSDAEIVLERGACHAVSALYIGGANAGSDRACRGALRVRGGSFICRLITMGWGNGADATLAVEGSSAEAVHVLDYVIVGSYRPGATSTNRFSFALDQNGVTPIVIASTNSGLIIDNYKLGSPCMLEVSLLAPPPRDPVTLIGAQVPTQGVFSGLPEGSEVKAEYAGRSYRWRLTYRGGSSGCDVMLTDVQGHEANAAVTKTRPRPAPPNGLWRQVPSREPIAASLPAFPGAEGFGAAARGGRGGKVLFVENLNDSGPGSLRAAVLATGPRTVVFRVGGEIKLGSPLSITEPFLTIAGQTATGDGILIRGHGLMVRTHDIVLRYLRIRADREDRQQEDCLTFYDAERCIADHCSLSWCTDEIADTTGLTDAVTIQRCILSEGLNYEGHGFGTITGGERSTWRHNLFAHLNSRMPLFAGICQVDFSNNVLYDWGHTAGYGCFEQLNYVGNYLKPGPATKQKPQLLIVGKAAVDRGSLFLSGNVLEGNPAVTADNWQGVGFDRTWAAASVPFPMGGATAESAEHAYEHVLNQAGATLPRRDAIDQRVVKSVRDRTGGLINSVADVGGWPSFQGGAPPADLDRDGCPDAWEHQHGFSSSDPNDGTTDADGDGYTQLEECLSQTDPRRRE